MSKQARLELLEITRLEYKRASWKEKQQLLDGFTRTTGYNRKYAIKLLGEHRLQVIKKRERERFYDDDVVEALKQIWLATNRIASKRLIPFLPVMLEKLERHRHLSLTPETKAKLLQMSASTADRLLREEKKKDGRSRSMTRPGRLLKKNVPVRTFADWNEAEPGFFEADLVSHCGGVASGAFLSTLTMTDIASGWIELLPVSGKSEAEVLRAIRQTAGSLPFPMKGLDTDNGNEFMNFATIDWCEAQKVTFTRAREYKKNDQAHVEEKNGSIVRRIVGYDRFEGAESLKKLAALYKVARLYVNYFQPSMKLLNKDREGARVRKWYDRAQSPYQRLMSSSLAPEVKGKLQSTFQNLDPIALLEQLEQCQVELWATATYPNAAKVASDSLAVALARAAGSSPLEEVRVQVRQHRAGLRARSAIKLSDSITNKAGKRHGQAADMRDFIFGLPAGQEFWVEDLLAFGSRESAKQQLRLLLKRGRIVRLKRGCYATPGPAKGLEPEPFLTTGCQAEDMRRYIFNLPGGQVFTVEDLLPFGSRPSARQLLRGLVRKKTLLRLGRRRYATVDARNNKAQRTARPKEA